MAQELDQFIAMNGDQRRDFLRDAIGHRYVGDQATHFMDLLADLTTSNEVLELMFAMTRNVSSSASSVNRQAAPPAADEVLLSAISRIGNGHRVSDPANTTIVYTTGDEAALLPAALTTVDAFYAIHGDDLSGMPAYAAAALIVTDRHLNDALPQPRTHISCIGIDKADFGKMDLSIDAVKNNPRAFARYGTVSAPAADGTWQADFGIVTLAVIAALNSHRAYAPPIVGPLVAFAAGLGLINRGRDGFSREWKTSPTLPAAEEVKAYYFLFTSDVAPLLVSAVYNILGLLGVIRIQHTHIYSASEEGQIQTMARLISAFLSVVPRFENMVFTLEQQDLTPDVVRQIMYAGLHCASMGGAVGFAQHWLTDEAASRFMAIRIHPMGDKGKAVAIVEAGINCIGGGALYQQIMGSKVVLEAQGAIDEYYTAIGGDMSRTSSLSRMLCGLEPIELTPAQDSKLRRAGILIGGFRETGVISDSITKSHFMRGLINESGGAMAGWTQLIELIGEKSADLSVEELLTALCK